VFALHKHTGVAHTAAIVVLSACALGVYLSPCAAASQSSQNTHRRGHVIAPNVSTTAALSGRDDVAVCADGQLQQFEHLEVPE
jgi:hypothetical protein